MEWEGVPTVLVLPVTLSDLVTLGRAPSDTQVPQPRGWTRKSLKFLSGLTFLSLLRITEAKFIFHSIINISCVFSLLQTSSEGAKLDSSSLGETIFSSYHGELFSRATSNPLHVRCVHVGFYLHSD